MKKIIQTLLTFFVAITPLYSVFATDGSNSTSITNPLGVSDLASLVAQIVKIAAQLGAIVCVFFIIYAGFLFVTAQGSDDKLTHAKTTLLWSVVGAAVLLGASVIANVVKSTVNQVTGSNI